MSLRDPTQTVELLQRAQAGDQDAYETLFTRYYPRVLRIVRSRMGVALRRHEDAEDIVQRTFIEAIRNLGKFEVRNDASLINWFARLVEHQVQNRAKYNAAQMRDDGRDLVLRRIHDSLSSGAIQFEPVASDTGVPERVARLEQEQILDQCLAELSEEYREVLVLRDLAGGRWEWIAEELGRPSAGAARELHRRARMALMRTAQTRLEP